MMEPTYPMIALMGATFLAAGFVKGVTGMGLPTVAMAVLGALVSPVAAAGLLIVPSLVTNIWQLIGPGSGGLPVLVGLWRRLWTMMAGIVVGTFAGVGWLAAGGGMGTTGLGVALMGYAAYTLFARQIRVPARSERWLSPLIGLLTGAVSGATGVFVIPAVPYLQALDLGRPGHAKAGLVRGLGLSFTVSTVALAVGLWGQGALGAGGGALSVLAVLPALLGMWLGAWARGRISAQVFRRVFLSGLLVLGAEMALRGVL